MARKPNARTFGQDLMRGEHVVGTKKANAEPAGGGGGPWKTMNEKLAANRDKLQSHVPGGLAYGEMQMFDGAERTISGTSIFDPVLCELVYRWFCPPGGLILDPFAGGSVRGVVASRLGRRYVGIDLSERQLEANRVQAAAICRAQDPMPVWHDGDSRDISAETIPDFLQADLVFSCPPYADLERYSDDPADLSTMDYPAFRTALGEVISACVALLAQDRFAVFVVGDTRGPDGFFYGLPGDTIRAFERAGARLYNEAILVTAAGSLPIRTRRQFETTRKLGKTHQQILVFCKGDAKRATQAVGKVDFGIGEPDGFDLDGGGDEVLPGGPGGRPRVHINAHPEDGAEVGSNSPGDDHGDNGAGIDGPGVDADDDLGDSPQPVDEQDAEASPPGMADQRTGQGRPDGLVTAASAALGQESDAGNDPRQLRHSAVSVGQPTPIDAVGPVGPYWLKRDDLFEVAGVRGGKVRTCWHLAAGALGLITAGSRSSPQVNIVAHIARELGIPCRVHVPGGELGPEVMAAEACGAKVIQHAPGYNSVIVKRASDDMKGREGWVEIPFGMECQEAVEQTASQVPQAWPEGVERIVIPVGSGMSAAGLITGMARIQNEGGAIALPVLGVVVGADPTKRFDKFLGEGWRDWITLVAAGLPYDTPAPECRLGDVVLDPIYEAKCLPFLEPGDLLWVVGIRATL